MDAIERTTLIKSDQLVNGVVSDPGDGRRFKLFHGLVESGAWARWQRQDQGERVAANRLAMLLNA